MSIASARLTAKQQTGKAEVAPQRDRTLNLQAQPSQGPDTPPAKLKALIKAPPLNLQLSQEVLRRTLPMKSGGGVKLPIMLHSPEVIRLSAGCSAAPGKDFPCCANCHC